MVKLPGICDMIPSAVVEEAVINVVPVSIKATPEVFRPPTRPLTVTLSKATSQCFLEMTGR